MTAERELVRVICQAERKGAPCRATAARILMVDGQAVIRFARRSRFLTSINVAVLTRTAELAAVEAGAIDGAVFSKLTAAQRRHIHHLMIAELSKAGYVDTSAALEPVVHVGLVNTPIEQALSDVRGWWAIPIQCPRCLADLRLDDVEAWNALNWSTEKVRNLSGYPRV